MSSWNVQLLSSITDWNNTWYKHFFSWGYSDGDYTTCYCCSSKPNSLDIWLIGLHIKQYFTNKHCHLPLVHTFYSGQESPGSIPEGEAGIHHRWAAMYTVMRAHTLKHFSVNIPSTGRKLEKPDGHENSNLNWRLWNCEVATLLFVPPLIYKQL